MEEQTNITAKDKLYKLDELLDSYEKQSGLPPCQAPGKEEELQRYLEMDRDEIEKLTPELCSQIIYRLSQYAFYLKRLFNREKSRAVWARQELTNMIAKLYGKYDKFTKFEINVALITKEDSYAQSIQKILTYAEERAQRLDELALYMKHLSDSVKAIQMTKVQMIRNP